MGDHSLELMQVGCDSWNILTGPHGHDPIDMGKCICYQGSAGDINYARIMDLTCQGVFRAGAGR